MIRVLFFIVSGYFFWCWSVPEVSGDTSANFLTWFLYNFLFGSPKKRFRFHFKSSSANCFFFWGLILTVWCIKINCWCSRASPLLLSVLVDDYWKTWDGWVPKGCYWDNLHLFRPSVCVCIYICFPIFIICVWQEERKRILIPLVTTGW